MVLPKMELSGRGGVSFVGVVTRGGAWPSLKGAWLRSEAPPPFQVATGQPHEGSSYAARKGCQLALNRMEYARRRLAELARGCQQLLDA